MKHVLLDKNNLPTAFYDDAVHKNIPLSAKEITDEQWQSFLENPGKKQFDTVNKSVIDYKTPFDLLVAQNQTIRRLKSDRNSAIIQPITSKALGTPHDYETTPDRVAVINLLLGIGLGGQIECKSPQGSTFQRQHTHQQLVILASAIAANKIAVYTDFETLKNSVTIAKNEADIIAVNN